jgi:cobalt-zinc-cadmium efflux system membrane fusion protein
MTERDCSALLLLLVAAACGKSAPPQRSSPAPTLFHLPGEQATQLQLVTVQEQMVRRPLRVPAQVTFDGLHTSDVVPLVDGKVSKLLVREGDRVKAGQPLLAIASPSGADAQASLDRDTATLNNARNVLARDQDLYQHKAISLEELQQAELAVASAKASLESDRTRVRVTGTGRGEALLRSPLAGLVVARHISVGESVQAGVTATFTVTDPAAVWVMAQLYQDDLRRVAVGDPVEIHSSVLEEPLEARVSYVGAALDPDTLAIPVRIAARNPSGILKNGMYVDASITPQRAEKAMILPATAVLRDSDNLPFVYVQAEAAGFARRHIDLGDQVGGSFVVRSGVSPGEKVVADGAIFVQFADTLGQ